MVGERFPAPRWIAVGFYFSPSLAIVRAVLEMKQVTPKLFECKGGGNNEEGGVPCRGTKRALPREYARKPQHQVRWNQAGAYVMVVDRVAAQHAVCGLVAPWQQGKSGKRKNQNTSIGVGGRGGVEEQSRCERRSGRESD